MLLRPAKRKLAILGLAVLIAAAVVPIALAARDAGTVTEVKIGGVPSMLYAPLYVAEARGFLAKVYIKADSPVSAPVLRRLVAFAEGQARVAVAR